MIDNISFPDIDERRAMRKNYVINLSSSDGSRTETFTVKGNIGRGASFLCYTAEDSSHNMGTLKEYYPVKGVNGKPNQMKRKNRQLVPTDPAFEEQLAEGIARIENNHKMLSELQYSNEVMRNYLSAGELWYGKGTVYLFYKNDKIGTRYDEYLDMLFKENKEKPELILLNILEVLGNLADTLHSLNLSKLFCLDLKPDNFMVLRSASGDMINEITYIFDTDSFADMDSIGNGEAYLPNYNENGFYPRTLIDKQSFREDAFNYKEADAFEILAILFWSITGKTKMIGTSSYLKDQLLSSKLLKKCTIMDKDKNKQIFLEYLIDLYDNTAFPICDDELPPKHFNCGKIAEKIAALKYMVLKYRSVYALSGNGYSTESASDYYIEMMFNNTLYRHPLYTNAGNDSIKVLILGFGGYGKQAFNSVLANGSSTFIIDSEGEPHLRNLHITVVDSLFNIENHFKTMPALNQFASIRQYPEEWISDEEYDKDQIGCGYNNTYDKRLADICWVGMEVTNKTIKTIIDKYPANYVLCCLGNDRFNQTIAEEISKLCGKRNSYIGYIQDEFDRTRSSRKKGKTDVIYPIWNIEEIHPHLRRFAYNTHFLYMRAESERLTREVIDEEFNKDYNKQSSYASALAIRYKLENLGYKFGPNTDFMKIAADYRNRFISDENNSKDIDFLVYIEHRRWCANQIKEGFQRPPLNKNNKVNYNYILNDNRLKGECTDPVTGQKKKYHPALVSSSPNPKMTITNSFDWSNPSVDGLDELDKVSVSLQQFLYKHLNDNDKEIEKAKKEIEDVIKYNQRAREEYSGLSAMLDLVYRGKSYGVKNIKFELYRFAEYIKGMNKPSDKEKEKAIVALNRIRNLLFIRLECLKMQKTNYKTYDQLFIKKLWFILSFNNFALIQDISGRDSNSLIWAVNNGLDMDCKKAVWVGSIFTDYPYCLKSPQKQINKYLEDYSGLLTFNKSRNCFSDTELHLFFFGKEPQKELFEYADKKASEMKLLSESIHIHYLSRSNDIKQVLGEIAESLINDRLVPVNGFNNDSLYYTVLNELKICSLSDEINSFVFNKSLSVREYMSLYGSEVFDYSYPRISNSIKILWGLYSNEKAYAHSSRNNTEIIWNNTIGILKNAYNKLVVAHFTSDYKTDKMTEYCSIETLLSDEKIMEGILSALVRNCCIKNAQLKEKPCNDYNASGLGYSSRKIYQIKFNYNKQLEPDIEKKIKNVISALSNMKMGQRIDYEIGKKNELQNDSGKIINIVVFNDKFSVNANTAGDRAVFYKNSQSDVNNLLYALEKYKYIRKESDGWRFICSDSDRRLLLTEGAVLEQFISSAMVISGIFSDVLANMRFRWSKTASSITNEIDVAATVGKSAVFVSAKAGKEIARDTEVSKETLYEIFSISNQFDAKPILVLGNKDAKLKDSILARANEMKGLCIIQREAYSDSDVKQEMNEERLIKIADRELDILGKEIEKAVKK